MRYRKKPVEIDAIQFVYSKDGIDALRRFAGAAIGKVGKDRHPGAKGYAEIGTLEDGDHPDFKVIHIATEGDYIIRGIKGEYYACKPDIFVETYEPVTTSQEDPFKKLWPEREEIPWNPITWSKVCPKCGIKLDSVMSYSCTNIECPTGLGPIISSVALK